MMKSSIVTALSLIFSFLFQLLSAQKPEIKGDSISVMMSSDDSAKVFDGYLLQKYNLIGGSASLLTKDMMSFNTTDDLLNQIQGIVSGLTIVRSGQPGETPKSYIRGISGFAGSTPLFIVDGMPVDDISLVNPNDISSLLVLKDASATALYGGRASNGAIVISTKKAQKGIHVRYDMAAGSQFPGNGPSGDLLSSKELADLQWLVYKNDKYTTIHPIYGPSTGSPTLPSWAANTDWYKEITKQSIIQDHNLSVSGGSEVAKIYIGTGYFNQNGIILNTFTKRYSARINSEISFFSKHIRIGENFQYGSRTGNYVPNLSSDSPVIAGPYRSPSIIPVYITNPITGPGHNFVPGEYGGTGISYGLGNSTNEVADRIRNKDDRTENSLIEGQVFADLLLFKGFTWRTSYGITKQTKGSIDYSLATYENSENLLTSSNLHISENRNSWDANSLLNYEREFGKHYLYMVAGVEKASFNKGSYESINRTGTDQNEGTLIQKTNYSIAPFQLQSFFIRAAYSFNDKYFLNISYRSDEATSAYTANNKNSFPTVGIGWRITNTRLLTSGGWLNDLKVKASYGKTGNIYYGKDSTFTTDLGFESRFFNNHLGFIFDWYSKKSSGLFLAVQLPGSGGSTPATFVNDAGMKNTGIDMTINYNQTFGNLRLNADCYFTAYRNTIGHLPGGFFESNSGLRLGSVVRNQEGHPVSSFYGYQVAGLFSSNAEVTNAPSQYGAATGFFRYVNQNTDNVISSADRTFLGNPHPDYTIGLHLQLTYKRFDIGALFYSVQGNEIFNYTKWWTDFWPSFQGQKSKRLLYESWTDANKNATVPMASNSSNFSTNTQSTSYYIEDGSYIRLKSLELGYNFNKIQLAKIKITSLRVYLQTSNLFTITKYSGLDPEIGGTDSAFGIDNGNYPGVKQLLVGLRLDI